MTEPLDLTPEQALSTRLSETVYQAIQNAANGTKRTKQQFEEFRLGVSNLGHCRQYAKLLIEQTPFTDHGDKTAAWVGTVLGGAIEDQLKIDHPDWLFQGDVVFQIPGGGEVGAHPDIIIPASAATDTLPQGVWDLKSKAELDTVKKYGQSQQQKFQLHAYAQACIDAGILDPTKPIWIADVFFDRSAKAGMSGHVAKPYVIGEWFDPEVISHIGAWVDDVKYAVIHREDASRDMPRDWCASFCEFFTVCRGADTDVTGTIGDPEVVAAARLYREGLDLEREGKRLKTSASITLNRIDSGVVPGDENSPPLSVRWTEVGGGPVSYVRQPYKKLDVRAIKTPKKGSTT